MQRGQQGGELSRKENNLKRFRWLSIVRLFHALEAFIIYGLPSPQQIINQGHCLLMAG
jgi:hypothetical protein